GASFRSPRARRRGPSSQPRSTGSSHRREDCAERASTGLPVRALGMFNDYRRRPRVPAWVSGRTSMGQFGCATCLVTALALTWSATSFATSNAPNPQSEKADSEREKPDERKFEPFKPELALVRLLPLAIRLLGLRVRRVRGRERSRGPGQREGRYQAGCTPELTHARPPGNPCRHSRPTPVIIKHPESPNR